MERREFRGDLRMANTGAGRSELRMHRSGDETRYFLKEINSGTGLQCSKNVFTTVIGCQHNDVSIGKEASDGRGRLDTAHFGHAQIPQDDIGAMLAIQFDGFLSVGSLSDYAHATRRQNI